jgi:hypothetical protein
MGHHVPYARSGWSSLPKLHSSYFEEATAAVFEGVCHAKMQCGGASVACTHVVPNNASKHFALLSLEGHNEVMFGGWGRPLAMPACQLEPLFERYAACLRKRST